MKPHTIYIVVSHDDEKVWEKAIAPVLSAQRLRILTPEFTVLVDHLTTENAALFGIITAQPIIYLLTDDRSVPDEALVEIMARLRTRTKPCKIILRASAQVAGKAQESADEVVDVEKQGSLAATVIAVAKRFTAPTQ